MSISSKQAKTGENPSGTEVGHGGEVGNGGGQGGGGVQLGADEEICYLGHFEHTTDDKKRLQVPSKWRPENMNNYEVTVVLWTRESEAESCLMVFPPNEMKRLWRSVRKKPWGSKEGEILKRALGGNAETVKYDSAGRICIPDRLAKPAGIGKNSEVVMVGMMDTFQLWNVERFQAVNSKDAVKLPDVLSQLGQEDEQ